eukprot:6464235-Amphidinium_carterae.1
MHHLRWQLPYHAPNAGRVSDPCGDACSDQHQAWDCIRYADDGSLKKSAGLQSFGTPGTPSTCRKAMPASLIYLGCGHSQ